MITYIRGEEFHEFATWLARQLGSRAFDSGNPLPLDAAKKILAYLEPAIAQKVLYEAANIARTTQLRSDSTQMKEAIVASLEKRKDSI